MNKYTRLIVALLLVAIGSGRALAADSTVSAMTAASALTGSELLYCVQGGADRKCTATQVQTFASTGLAAEIASGATALGTSAISSAACATVVTATATGTATTDAPIATFNSDPTAVTGYIPSTSGGLTIFVYPTVNAVNFKVCNFTSASITPGAVTLNWRVVR